MEIEFEGDNELSRFGIYLLNANGNSTGPGYLEWNLKINSARMDSILSTIGWDRETLKTLKANLDNANCIEIESGEPTKIGFKRSGMGMYSFNVFDSPFSDSIREMYKDTCAYIIVSDKLILEYGGEQSALNVFTIRNEAGLFLKTNRPNINTLFLINVSSELVVSNMFFTCSLF